jgi:hypothetical protein
LFDHDADGYIEEAEMVEVIEALEGLETGGLERGRSGGGGGAVPASLLFDERGNLVVLPTPEERARDLFKVIYQNFKTKLNTNFWKKKCYKSCSGFVDYIIGLFALRFLRSGRSLLFCILSLSFSFRLQ